MSALSGRVWVALAAALAAVAVWPSLQSLAQIWREVHDYQHGWLIAPIAIVWFGLVLRGPLPGAPRASYAATMPLALALAAWLVAYNANSQMAHQLLAPWVLGLSVLAVSGPKVTRAFAAPIGFLYFATPIWDYAVPVLQRLSVWATESALALVGVPAVVSEYVVTIPEGTFRIIEGCSGKRYFMVTLAMAVLSAHVHGIRGWRYPVFVAGCGLLAMIANYVRIFTVIYAGHVSRMQHYFVAVEHKSLGNAIFVVLLLAVFLLARRLASPHSVQRASAGGRLAAEGSPGGRIVLVALLGLAIGLTQARASASLPPPRLLGLPVATGTWQGPLPASPSWQPRYPGAADSRRAAYVSPAGTVEVYVNVYGEQRQGEGELIQYGNTLLAPGEWTRAWPLQADALQPARGPALLAFEARAPSGQRWLVARVFDVGGKLTTSELAAQLSYGLQSTLRPVPAGVFALASQCDGNCEAARALVKSFWDDMSGPVRGARQDGLREEGSSE